ncbi:Anhydro-N-acetylmuramic acid kinase [Candidatus Brocadiaceae bacterium]|nr:Anhydro-N-acetylmuramic acid kinase [Candidatus Brocadiaceae bacterium]
MTELYIGLMSGTSLDGIDAALVEFRQDRLQLISFAYQPYSDNLKTQLKQLSDAHAMLFLKDYGAMDAQLGLLFAQAVETLLAKINLPAAAIKAIGSHGQTVHHEPTSPLAFSLQIGDPNLIAEKTGITTIADFRRRDIAAGGQGAPLVPAFHQAVFSHATEHRCVVNIGGIANITILPPTDSAPIIGFDTGPGNILIDQWIQKHLNLSYDAKGEWAKTGKIDIELAEKLKQDSYFQLAPAKSTGKEYFSLAWIYQNIKVTEYKAEDIQATLCYLTASTITDAIKQYAPNTDQVLICGGGIHNNYLLQLIEQQLNCPVNSTELYGIHPDHVEAMAFAWLARQTLNHATGNLKEVTGAKHNVILGGIYPALT